MPRELRGQQSIVFRRLVERACLGVQPRHGKDLQRRRVVDRVCALGEAAVLGLGQAICLFMAQQHPHREVVIAEFAELGGQSLHPSIKRAGSHERLGQKAVEGVLVASLAVRERTQIEIELQGAVRLSRDGLEQRRRIRVFGGFEQVVESEVLVATKADVHGVGRVGDQGQRQDRTDHVAGRRGIGILFVRCPRPAPNGSQRPPCRFVG